MSEEIEIYIANDSEWEAYKAKFSKSYEPHDESHRRKTWEGCVASCNKHNEEYKQGTHTYTVGINQFSDGTRPCYGLLPPE